MAEMSTDSPLGSDPVGLGTLGRVLENTPLNPEAWRIFVAGLSALLYFPCWWLIWCSVFGLDWRCFEPTGDSGRRSRDGQERARNGHAGRGVSTGEDRKPAGLGDARPIPEQIEAEIAQRLDGQSRIDLASLRSSLAPEKRATLLQALETAFTDVDLLHAQYYQDPRIIDYVAQVITVFGGGVGEPEWELDSAALETPAQEQPAVHE